MPKKILCILSLVLVVLTAAPAPALLGPAFSLDDNPARPLTSPLGLIPGFGAEDPFGLGTFGGALAPSPTLPAIAAEDADILKPDPTGMTIPAIDMPMSMLFNQPLGYLNAASDTKARLMASSDQARRAIHLGFSVDRISRGLGGTAVNKQVMLGQQPGDVFYSAGVFPHPAQFLHVVSTGVGYAGPLPSIGGGGLNRLLMDESTLCLTAGNGPGIMAGPGVACPMIKPGSHDNLDALTYQLFDIKPDDARADRWLFFSVAPDEFFISGRISADILVVPPMAPAGAAQVYAPASTMGLHAMGMENLDDIDALIVWEEPGFQEGFADPGVDCALFSLSHGSVSLNQNGLSEADVFFTNFTGSFWLYARAADLGLNWYGPQEFGDNVDALEAMLPGDANLDGAVDIQDFVILKQNYNGPGGWLQGDFNGDGVVNIQDFIILKQNYNTTL